MGPMRECRQKLGRRASPARRPGQPVGVAPRASVRQRVLVVAASWLPPLDTERAAEFPAGYHRSMRAAVPACPAGMVQRGSAGWLFLPVGAGCYGLGGCAWREMPRRGSLQAGPAGRPAGVALTGSWPSSHDLAPRV